MTDQFFEVKEAFDVEHFKDYCARLVIDTGAQLELEDFQLEICQPILDGVKEVWAILPESNGKTSLMAAVALYHADFTPNPWVPIAASSRDQAEILARQAYQMIRATPGMLGRFRIFEGYREIRSLQNGGRGIKVYAADTTTGDGVIPTLAICDEGHRWVDLALYRLWRGKLGKRSGQIVMISTAGEPGGDFEDTRDAIRDQLPHKETVGCHTQAWGPQMVMHEWRVQNEKDCKDPAKVKEANPFSVITEESLREELTAPTCDFGNWKRLKCNLPSRTIQAAITEEEWAKAKVHLGIPAGDRIDVGVDSAWKHDTFAIAPIWHYPDENYDLLGDPTVLTPPRDGSSMHPDVVKEAFIELHARNPIDTAVMDLERANDIGAWLEDELGITVVDRPQTNMNAVEDYDCFMRGLRGGTLKHTNADVLRRHVMNAIGRQLPGDKRRFDRPSQSRAKRRQEMRVIDALTAAAMVNWYRMNFTSSELPLVTWR